MLACLLASLAPIDMTFAVIFSLPFPSLPLSRPSLRSSARNCFTVLPLSTTPWTAGGRTDGGGTDTSIGKQTENNCEIAAAVAAVAAVIRGGAGATCLDDSRCFHDGKTSSHYSQETIFSASCTAPHPICFVRTSYIERRSYRFIFQQGRKEGT